MPTRIDDLIPLEGAPRRILVLDDEEAICDIIQRIAGLMQVEAVTAYHVDEAIGVLEREQFGLLVVDVCMPEQSGLVFVKHVRDSQRHADCPILVCSGYYLDNDLGKVEGAFENCVALMKPLSSDTLREVVDRVLPPAEGSSAEKPFSPQSEAVASPYCIPVENGTIEQISEIMKLFLATDGLSAAVSGPYGNKTLPGVGIAEITQWLASREVIYGILQDACETVLSVLSGNNTDKLDRLVIAQGREAVPGDDGFVDYTFSTSLQAGAPDEDGRLDFRERGLVNNTSAKMLLARVVPPTEGTPGMTVSGKKLPASSGKRAVSPSVGAGVESSQDGSEYYATIEGHATLLNNRIQVTRELHIEGDIDYSFGNLDFVGDLVIDGMIQSGFSAKAGGNITIKGSVERHACVWAGGNVVVLKTIRCGRKTVGVEAEGNISAPRIENSRIKAGGDVLVSEEIINSRVNCYGRLLAQDAGVRGSGIEAVGGMELCTLGSRDGSSNTLTAGITLKIDKQITRAREGIEEGRKRLIFLNNAFREKNGRAADQLEGLDGLSDEERESLNIALNDHRSRCEAVEHRITEFEKSIGSLERDMAEIPGAIIAIKKKISPPCTLNLGRNEWMIPKAMTEVVFFDDFRNNRIGTRSYKEGIFEDEVETEEAGPSLSDLDALKDEVENRKVSATALAKRLREFVNEGPAFLKEAMALGLMAASHKRYQSPDVFECLGAIHVELIRSCEGSDERTKLGVSALRFLKKATDDNVLHAQAFSTMGELYDLLNKHDEAEEAHNKAVHVIKHQKGQWEDGKILSVYALSLVLRSEAASKNEDRTEFRQRAEELFRLAEERGATGPAMERCRAEFDAEDGNEEENAG